MKICPSYHNNQSIMILLHLLSIEWGLRLCITFLELKSGSFVNCSKLIGNNNIVISGNDIINSLFL